MPTTLSLVLLESGYIAPDDYLKSYKLLPDGLYLLIFYSIVIMFLVKDYMLEFNIIFNKLLDTIYKSFVALSAFYLPCIIILLSQGEVNKLTIMLLILVSFISTVSIVYGYELKQFFCYVKSVNEISRKLMCLALLGYLAGVFNIIRTDDAALVVWTFYLLIFLITNYVKKYKHEKLQGV